MQNLAAHPTFSCSKHMQAPPGKHQHHLFAATTQLARSWSAIQISWPTLLTLDGPPSAAVHSTLEDRVLCPVRRNWTYSLLGQIQGFDCPPEQSWPGPTDHTNCTSMAPTCQVLPWPVSHCVFAQDPRAKCKAPWHPCFEGHTLQGWGLGCSSISLTSEFSMMSWTNSLAFHTLLQMWEASETRLARTISGWKAMGEGLKRAPGSSDE